MDEDWGDDDYVPAPSADSLAGGNSFAPDGGVMFSRGRGFSLPSKTNDNDGWSNQGNHRNNGDSWGGKKFDDADENGGWGDSGDDGGRPQRGGRGGGRGGGGRGGGRGGPRGGGRGRGRGGGRSSEWGGGDKNDQEDSWGGSNNQDGGGWGNGGGDNDSNGNDFDRRGGRGGRFGRGRGRGGRGGRNEDGGGGGGGWGEDGGNDDAKTDEPPKPKENYIPPEPTQDENEIFSTAISTGINFSKYDDIEVQVSGENVPQPISSFDSSGLRKFVLDNVKKCGYTKPTPIQKHAIPIIKAGRDIMACAQTGSGKTAAFLLPIIDNLLSDPKDLVLNGECSEPQVIVVSPTRELAIQIFEEARKFSLGSSIKVVIAYGGTSVAYQRKHVLAGCHILVATPGRMNDFVKRGHISFSSTRFVVLDEADRMLDMGFLTNMEEMLSHNTMVPTGERRTLMFSATFPEEIQQLASKFLDNYIFVAVGIVGGACTDVEQVIYQVDRIKKRNKLVEILRKEGTERTLVFVETKRNADFLASYLSENDFQCTSIHGDRLQREREEALRDFKSGTRNILVATAVAARGLDIKGVKHVINYDLPKDIDEYVHRIGRTGRLGNRGKATSFFDDGNDGPIAGNLAKILKEAGQNVPDWLGHSGGGTYSSSAFGGCDVRDGNFDQQPAVEVQEEDWS